MSLCRTYFRALRERAPGHLSSCCRYEQSMRYGTAASSLPPDTNRYETSLVTEINRNSRPTIGSLPISFGP